MEKSFWNNLIASSIQFMQNHDYTKVIVLTLLLFVLVRYLRKFFISSIRKKNLPASERLILTKRIKHYSNYVVILALFLLWFSQLQGVFVSLIAVAAAIVIAFKEIIMCFTGGILLRSAKTYKEGQRIEIDGVRGFVIESNMLSTKILELGPEKNSQQTTGDVITIPNSLVLSNTVKNESYFQGYTIKSFTFKVNEPKKVDDLEAAFFEKASEICNEYLSEATRTIHRFCEKEGISIPAVAPRTKVLFNENFDLIILVKIPVKNTNVADVEQLLNRFFIDWNIKHLKNY